MLKKDILDIINSFEVETWKYVNSNNNLDHDMEYIYSIEKEIINEEEINLKSIYDKLIALIGIIKFKYGFESLVVNNNPELENLKQKLEDISLNSSDIINQYNNVITFYKNYISRIKNVDFIENKYIEVQGKEKFYLAIESLKSLINN